MCVSLVVFTCEFIYAQRWKRVRYEVFAAIGPSLYNGDLGGGRGPGKHFLSDIDIQATRYCISIGARYKIREKFSTKLNFYYGRLNGSDFYTSYLPRFNRGVSFKSGFFEPSLQFEYSILKERIGIRYTLQNLRRFKLIYVNTYVFTGFGGIYFNPKTINKDFPTNRNEEYSKFQLIIPIGLGFKYGIDRLSTIGLEFCFRYTTTDYLDGFSDKFGKSKDSYFTFSIIYSRRLKTARSGLPKF
ncbi:MAG: DUF6089 family protein [Bacteroidales bacterium]|nr:DUF6089 family protein [Bacteroidales bacterium]